MEQMDWINPLIYVVGGIAVVGAVWKLAHWKGGVDEFKRGMDGFRSDVREAIQEIRSDIKEILGRLPSASTIRTSPIELSNLGKAISQEIDAAAWAEKTAHNLLEKVRDKPPFEIQEFCFDYARRQAFSGDLFTKMRQSVYEHGTTMGNVRDVLAVELRNALLKLTAQAGHPGR